MKDMAYKLLKPEIISVSGATWIELKNRWNKLRNNRYFWLIVCGGVLFVVLTPFIPQLLVLPALYVFYVMNEVRSTFWKQVADVNGWQYKESGDPTIESAIMFQQGRRKSISHSIEGIVGDRQFRMFNYEFSVGHSQPRIFSYYTIFGAKEGDKTYPYTVFAFRFEGTFPHIYLNNKHNSYSINVGEKLPLPAEFEKQFILSAPRKYETEALEIFTPDILTKLLDGGFTHDIELVDHEFLMFVDGSIDKFEKLEKEFNKAMELEDLFDEKLDRFKFEKIGDMSHKLK